MIAATVLAVFFVPVFYVVMQRLAELRRKPAAATLATTSSQAPGHSIHSESHEVVVN